MQSKIFTITTPKILCALALALAAIGSAQAQNLVVNGGFETGDFTGWSTEAFYGSVGVSSGSAHSGTFSAGMSAPAESGGSGQISQSFATVAGTQYQLSFWSEQGFGGFGSYLSASVNGTQVYANSRYDSTYFLHAVTFTASSATSSISFVGSDNFGVRLDDVSVTAVPEPSQWALIGFGLAAMGVVARRQRNVKR